MSAPAASALAALRARRRPRPSRVITRISGYEKQEFVLRIVQPSLVGMIDGTVSKLAPIFAAAVSSNSGTRCSSDWLPRSAPGLAWDSRKRSQTTASTPAEAQASSAEQSPVPPRPSAGCFTPSHSSSPMSVAR